MQEPKLTPAEKDRFVAHLGMYGTNDVSIWGQYDHLVDFIFEEYPKTNQRFDIIAAPLLHTIAHGIELGLKENIAFFREYHGKNQLKYYDNWTALIKSHDLAELADEFRIGYFRLADQLKLRKEEREIFNEYYAPLEELVGILDRASETFRYAAKIDKDGEFIKMSIDGQKTFDFLKIKELFDGVKHLLIGAPNSVAHYTDFTDFQRANKDYDAGKGYLYCQRLYYTEHFLKNIEGQLAETMKLLPSGIWFDPKTAENYEVKVWQGYIYIIAVDMGKVMRRPKKSE